MAKGHRKKDTRNPKRRTRDDVFAEEDMDDEIDAFHKQRDVIPLDVDEDLGAASDEDNEQPVFEFEDDDDSSDGDGNDDGKYDKGLTARIARAKKSMRREFGGVEDEMHDDVEEEEEKELVWHKRGHLYGADVDWEPDSSDEDLFAEEEVEAKRKQLERAKSLRMEDIGLKDDKQDESDSDEQDGWVQERKTERRHADEDGTCTTYDIKKDLNALTKDEQMDIVYSSAPELVGLLSELNDALSQLENNVDPLLHKVKEKKYVPEGGTQYLEVKRLLLLTYCQSISFYLLLKSEGHIVRDHPVIARLVEIKSLLDKVKEIDGSLPSEIREILNHEDRTESGANIVKENASSESEPCPTNNTKYSPSVKTNEVKQASKVAEFVKVDILKDNDRRSLKKKSEVGLQSLEMLKVRENLEEKLKSRGIYGPVVPKADKTPKCPSQPVNRRLETLADFDDEVIHKEAAYQGATNGLGSSAHHSQLSHLVATKVNKPRVVSGDDDLPVRDDIGERRRKYELQVLAKAGGQDDDEDEDGVLRHAGAESMDVDVEEDGKAEESEDEFYKQVKQQRAAKLSAKTELFSRTPLVPSLQETEVDGKRKITYQMEKNKGLTRARKKLTKIPRKKYKLKHQKAVVRRKGQVRDIRKPSGPYGGETTGINTGISRSIRFKG